MEVIAKGKYIKVSPKKAREIVSLVRGKNAKEAREAMKFMPQVAAKEIFKVVSSAVANAQHNFSLEPDALTISSITIDGGPTLKRYRPRARGRVSNIKRKTSHITVIVSGDVKTKKPASTDVKSGMVTAPKPKTEAKKEEAMPESIENEATPASTGASQGEEHKLEMERPAFAKKEQEVPKFDVKGKFFRRKTG